MTFLPIVDRELRVASRQRATFSMRLRIAVVAIIIGSCVLFSNLGAPPATIGNFIFTGLSILALVYCLLSGRRSTVDCLSEEKREGTLGLLFLTDLKGYDVVLGKLVATSLNAFYGLLAIFPVLAIPMLMGGVSNREFWRMVLVLVNTFLFSLAIGIYSSAKSRETRRAMGLNFALLIFFTVLVPGAFLALMAYLNLPRPIFGVLITSPICTFAASLDSAYKIDPHIFWWSLGLIHCLSWLFVMKACRILPHSWQDQPLPPRRAAKSRGQAFRQFLSYGNPAKRDRFRKRLLDVNAYYWLAARVRLKPVHVWAFLSLVGCWWIWVRFKSGMNGADDVTSVVMAVLLNTTLKLWVATESGQRLAEDKKIGSLELLLSTPLNPRDIVRGQLMALRRQFLAPVIFIVLLELILMEITARAGPPFHPELRVVWLAGIVMLLLDLAALSLVGMSQALSSKAHNQAALTTVTLILALPWLGVGFESTIHGLWATFVLGTNWDPDWRTQVAWWFSLGILADVVFGALAWKQLPGRMRRSAMERFAPQREGGWFIWRRNLSARTSALPSAIPAPPKSRSRKNLVRGVIALALFVACAGFFMRRSKPDYPQAIVVPVSLSHEPLQVFPHFNGTLFILPDGSVWQWGQAGGNHPAALVPTPFTPGNDWIRSESGFGNWVGLRKVVL